MTRIALASLLLLGILASSTSATSTEQVHWGRLKAMWSDGRIPNDAIGFVQPGITESEASQAVQDALADFGSVDAVLSVMATKGHRGFLVITKDGRGWTAHLVSCEGGLLGRAAVDPISLAGDDNSAKIARDWYSAFCGFVSNVVRAKCLADTWYTGPFAVIGCSAVAGVVMGTCLSAPDAMDNFVEEMSESDAPPSGWDRQNWGAT